MNFDRHRGGGYRRALWTEKIFSQADAHVRRAVTGPTSLNGSHEKKGRARESERENRGRRKRRDGGAKKSAREMGTGE